MPTINTIEDLLRLLDENPQWVQALRARLLTRELIELPESFAKFVEEVRQRFDRIDTDIKTMKGDIVTLKSDMVEVKGDIVTLKSDVAEVKGDIVILKSDVKAIRDDVAPLKGAHARNAALREADLIAESMGFVMVRVLSQDDIKALAQARDTSGMSKDELRSFRLADLIMEATGPHGDSCYVAVEVSFTVNGRDTSRAVRNAAFLASFTGRPAYAAVAGARMDERVRDRIESGDVFWYQLDPQSLEAE